jgi:hypothetical protein
MPAIARMARSYMLCLDSEHSGRLDCAAGDFADKVRSYRLGRLEGAFFCRMGIAALHAILRLRHRAAPLRGRYIEAG